MAEIDVFTLREELYHFASSYDNLMLSAEGKFLKMVNDSEAIYQDNENEFNLDFVLMKMKTRTLKIQVMMMILN